LRLSENVILLFALLLIVAIPANAHEEGEGVESITVFGRADRQIGEALSASEGRVGGYDLSLRPMDRVGELLEAVPGLIATQHAGAGKSNQLFLRGFNLDHGTDFAAHFDGVPINLRSHGHGQGYLDLNFLIPEVVSSIDFRKGPYRADVGDFSSAGASFLRSYDALPASVVSLTGGEHRLVRGLAAVNVPVSSGSAIVALDGRTFQDPYELDANLLQLKGFAKRTLPVGGGTLRLSGLGYYGDWDSTDQIPRDAIETGRVPRLGFLDPDLGGKTIRLGLNAEWEGDEESPLRLSTYFLYYRLELFSNYTYYLDPDNRGDELEQRDERFAWGARVQKDFSHFLFDDVDLTLGSETRLDVIPEVGLYRTEGRQRFETVREDTVREASASGWLESSWTPFHWMTWRAGARIDLFVFDVDAKEGVGGATNSGTEVDAIVSPKLGLALHPIDALEFYLNAGGGFHSNDARGTTITIDPSQNVAVDSVDALARQWGAEVGARWQPDRRVHLTAALWWLRSESELVFVGDGGFTEAQGASRRYGVELTGFARPFDWLALDASYAWSSGDFKGQPSGEDRIPGAIENVASAGATVTLGRFDGSLRVRHLGAYPLNETNTQRAGSTTLVNLGAGYEWEPFRLALTVVNLFDSKDSDIEYFYESQVDPAPVGTPREDVHLHPVAPRQIRATVSVQF
jgi:hypothetical protein